MVATKQQLQQPIAAASNNSAYEIRSGMSVQDLKQLTAQRAQRQRMEYWDLQARNSPRSGASDWSPASSTSSSSSSRSDSPPRQFSKHSVYTYPSFTRSQQQQQYHAHHAHHHHQQHHHHHHHYAQRGSPSLSPSGEPEKMFVTCGGQVVSFMEGVVNAPQFDFLPEMLNATL